MPHPTLNLWTTQNVGEVIPGFPKPLVADLYAQFDIITMEGIVERIGEGDLVQLSPPLVANFFGFFFRPWSVERRVDQRAHRHFPDRPRVCRSRQSFHDRRRHQQRRNR